MTCHCAVWACPSLSIQYSYAYCIHWTLSLEFTFTTHVGLRCTCPCCWLDKTVPRYPKAQVQVSDIPNVLKLAHDLLGPDVADITTAVASHGSRALDLFYLIYALLYWFLFCYPCLSLHHVNSFDIICPFWTCLERGVQSVIIWQAFGRGDLWQRLASHELPSIQPIWRRVSDWLLQAPEDVPPVVFMTMLWASLDFSPFFWLICFSCMLLYDYWTA